MVSFDVDRVLADMTLEEKCLLLSGRDNWHTVAFPHHGVPSIRVSDGPNGVRGTKFFDAVPAASFPCGTALGATFDRDLLFSAGQLMAKEAKAKGVHAILGPTINIQRSPLGGRGFESFSEDPVLSGLCAAAIVNGMQSLGIQSTIKHFVCNDQEDGRMFYNAFVTERALREIYLMAFQIAMRDSSPASVMTAYNKVNGVHVSQSVHLLEEVLRKEWNWDGLAMSDWTGVFTTKESIIAGLDLEMPGPPKWRGKLLEGSVSSKELPLRYVDSATRRTLRFIKKCIEESGVPENASEESRNTPDCVSLLRKLSADSIVVLKNERNVLPFDKNRTIAVIGPNGKVTAYCGGGSASLTPYYTVSPYEGIESKVTTKPKFSLGVATFKELPLLGELLTDENGDPGYLLEVFSGPRDDPSRRLLETKHLLSSYMLLSDYTPPGYNTTMSPFCFDILGYFIPEETGTYRFGLTVSGAATLYVDNKLVVDNSKNQRPGTAFFGGGTLEETGIVDLVAGQKYTINCYYSRQSPLFRPGLIDFTGGLRIGAALVRPIEEELKRAVKIAKEVDQVVLAIGLNSEWESEGFDRSNMDLPPHTDQLVEAVCEVNPNVAVVIQSGTPVTMPWVDRVPTILQAWYGGDESGNGIADVLFGDVNPSGKLCLSYPKRVEDNPAFLHFKSDNGETLYNDDIYVGYRNYEITKRDVLFPFGHGLSYSTFVFSSLDIEVESDNVKVSITVRNTGERAGAEVAQFYVAPVKPSVNRPIKELKSIEKVFVETGSEVRLETTFSLKYATSYWNVELDNWTSEAGQYRILVGKCSADISLEGIITVEKTNHWTGL
jgi:beta-glucosidase